MSDGHDVPAPRPASDNAHGIMPGGNAPALRAMVYVRDAESEAIIGECLTDLAIDSVSYSRGGIEAAIADLAHHQSPRLLIVDISGVDEPASRVADLAQLCEPSTGVVVVGDKNDVALYRRLKSESIVEYFFKPLIVSLVSQTCSFVLGGGGDQHVARTGKLVTVIGLRGGVGATGIAAAAAWHLAEVRHRHVLLVDLDLAEGDLALQLDVLPNAALHEALERPERVDDMFLERGVVHVASRLDLLASLESLDQVSPYGDDAVLPLLGKLLGGYRYIFLDLPPTLAPGMMGVLQLPGLCVLVSDSSLVAARDVARWKEKIGPNTAERVTFHVVNRVGAAGGLPIEEFVRILGHAPDLVIPYNREIGEASARGVKGLGQRGALAQALAPMLQQITGEPSDVQPSLLKRLFG